MTMDHVRYLAEAIGPRGSTTEQEAQAARYAARVLQQAGIEPVTETFASARSSYYSYALFAGVMLVAECLFLFGRQWGAVAALTLALCALASLLLELSFRPNPMRWLLPRGQSQNVWARLEPRGEVREQVVLLGHLDTHRTPLLFSSKAWVAFLGVIVPFSLLASILLIALFAIGIAAPGTLWRLLSLPLVAIVLGLLLLMLQADLTPHTAGANDNASGAAVVLSVAERLHEDPLAHTAVWAVLSGCEEVGCYGADAFAAAHREALGHAAWIPVDGVGGVGASVAYLTSERFLLTSHSDPGLLALADRVARRRPELDAFTHAFQSTYTEGAIGVKHGFRVLSVVGFRRDGRLPEWHRPTDVMANLDERVVEHSETFLWGLLHEIDQQKADKEVSS